MAPPWQMEILSLIQQRFPEEADVMREDFWRIPPEPIVQAWLETAWSKPLDLETTHMIALWYLMALKQAMEEPSPQIRQHHLEAAINYRARERVHTSAPPRRQPETLRRLARKRQRQARKAQRR
jgi:hypothetical protein